MNAHPLFCVSSSSQTREKNTHAARCFSYREKGESLKLQRGKKNVKGGQVGGRRKGCVSK
jgi:hypothetical protein